MSDIIERLDSAINGLSYGLGPTWEGRLAIDAMHDAKDELSRLRVGNNAETITLTSVCSACSQLTTTDLLQLRANLADMVNARCAEDDS